jgi:hypothetical protein
VGKRYTEEEKQLIRELATQGHTDQTIAQQVKRSTNAIRNYRHRTNIKTRETKTLQHLKQQTRELEQKRTNLEQRIGLLTKTLQIEENRFRNRLQTELIKLKDRKPELFYITGEEQFSKLKAQLVTSAIRWLIE